MALVQLEGQDGLVLDMLAVTKQMYAGIAGDAASDVFLCGFC